MTIFNYTNYKGYVNDWLLSCPKKGHGQFRAMAQHLRLSTVMISQIFRGDKDISFEHAHELSKFLTLTENETRYFLLLVQFARAGTENLKNFIKNQIILSQQENENLKKVVSQDTELTEEQKAVFHSNWIYSAIRMHTSLIGTNSIEAIAQSLGLSIEVVTTAIDFLLKTNLIIKENNVLKMGPQRTYLEKLSPFINARQKAWRIKSFELMDENRSQDLFYTGPMAISSSMRSWLDKELRKLINEIFERAVKEEAEDLCCLNIDFFRFTK